MSFVLLLNFGDTPKRPLTRHKYLVIRPSCATETSLELACVVSRNRRLRHHESRPVSYRTVPNKGLIIQLKILLKQLG